jgi:hypothetical protein
MQRLSAALHGTLGSCLRDALHEGRVDVVACLHAPLAKVCRVFPSMLLFASWLSMLFLVKILIYK